MYIIIYFNFLRSLSQFFFLPKKKWFYPKISISDIIKCHCETRSTISAIFSHLAPLLRHEQVGAVSGHCRWPVADRSGSALLNPYLQTKVRHKLNCISFESQIYSLSIIENTYGWWIKYFGNKSDDDRARLNAKYKRLNYRHIIYTSCVEISGRSFPRGSQRIKYRVS